MSRSLDLRLAILLALLCPAFLNAESEHSQSDAVPTRRHFSDSRSCGWGVAPGRDCPRNLPGSEALRGGASSIHQVQVPVCIALSVVPTMCDHG
jgi:hypothetical protein